MYFLKPALDRQPVPPFLLSSIAIENRTTYIKNATLLELFSPDDQL